MGVTDLHNCHFYFVTITPGMMNSNMPELLAPSQPSPLSQTGNIVMSGAANYIYFYIQVCNILMKKVRQTCKYPTAKLIVSGQILFEVRMRLAGRGLRIIALN